MKHPEQYSISTTTNKVLPRKTTLVTAIAMAMGGISLSAQAALTYSSTLEFDAGFSEITACIVPGVFNGTNCTVDGTVITALEVTDMGGSYFLMSQGGDPANEKTAISMFAPLHIGTTQASSGSHTGFVDGSESPAIDNPWSFLGNTGMHTLTSPISVISDFGSTKTLDFSGWGVNWGNFGPGLDYSTISMGGVATIVCSTSSCSTSSSYVLDMDIHVPEAFTSVPYSLHLEGHIGEVPVPAAGWLFGSGVMGLAGVMRRRRNKR